MLWKGVFALALLAVGCKRSLQVFYELRSVWLKISHPCGVSQFRNNDCEGKHGTQLWGPAARLAIRNLLTSRSFKAAVALLIGTLLYSPRALAQTSATFYLHGSSATPSVLSLDGNAPNAATAKSADSASVNFAGGNPWKEIGTWTASSTLTNGNLTALSSLHAWVGLKNSDDQGTQFDLQAEVYKNGLLVASALNRCITDITRNPNLAKEVFVSFGAVPTVNFNGTTDVLSLKILTRIGTNADGSKCPGHNNAVGLRLYFDAISRSSSFGATFSGSAATPTPPTILYVVPSSGPVGTPVAIVGTNFGSTQGNSTVTFNGTVATATSWSDTSILVTVPVGATTGPVSATAGGSPSNAANFIVGSPPTISYLLPNFGLAGTSITIAGSYFGATQGNSTVTFNGTVAVPASWSDTNIIVAVPSGATTGPVLVNVGGAVSQGVNFTVGTPPIISALSPSFGPTGSSVTITGKYFGAQQGNSNVTFNGVQAAPTSWSDTKIVVVLPSGAVTGPVLVTVGGAVSNALNFTVGTPPVSCPAP